MGRKETREKKKFSKKSNGKSTIASWSMEVHCAYLYFFIGKELNQISERTKNIHKIIEEEVKIISNNR